MLRLKLTLRDRRGTLKAAQAQRWGQVSPETLICAQYFGWSHEGSWQGGSHVDFCGRRSALEHVSPEPDCRVALNVATQASSSKFGWLPTSTTSHATRNRDISWSPGATNATQAPWPCDDGGIKPTNWLAFSNSFQRKTTLATSPRSADCAKLGMPADTRERMLAEVTRKAHTTHQALMQLQAEQKRFHIQEWKRNMRHSILARHQWIRKGGFSLAPTVVADGCELLGHANTVQATAKHGTEVWNASDPGTLSKDEQKEEITTLPSPEAHDFVGDRPSLKNLAARAKLNGNS